MEIGLGRSDQALDSLRRAVACFPGYVAAWAQLVAVTEHLGGEVWWTGPVGVPASREAAAALPDAVAWQAWLDRREARPVVDAATARAAVEAGLDALGTELMSGVWAILDRARAAGRLDDAVLILLFEDALVGELGRWHDAGVDGLVELLATEVVPVSR